MAPQYFFTVFSAAFGSQCGFYRKNSWLLVLYCFTLRPCLEFCRLVQHWQDACSLDFLTSNHESVVPKTVLFGRGVLFVCVGVGGVLNSACS